MTARTLEEIEREIAKLGSQKWYGAAHTLRLLAIAQEQRAEIARLQDNASTAAFDKIADQLGEANRENEEQRAEIAAMRKVIDIARVCANEGGYKQCPRTDNHHIALLEMDQAIKNIGTKR